MTYESLLHDLKQVYMYFLAFLVRFLEKIKEYPLIMLSLFILVVLPVLYFIFSFIASASASTDDVAEQGYQIYRNFKIREQKRKLKEQNEAFKREKINRQRRAYDLAQTFFANNPDRMSISIMGHKFFQDGFEHRNWSEERRKARRNYYSYHSNQQVNSSSTSHQGSSANIDVTVDDD